MGREELFMGNGLGCCVRTEKPLPRPRGVLALDLDGTVWDNEDISRLRPPFRRLGRRRVVDDSGVVVTLNHGVEAVLAAAESAGYVISTLSWNNPEIALEALKAFGIYDRFHYHCIHPLPTKHKCLKELLALIESETGASLSPGAVVYVDDRSIHAADIASYVGEVRFFLCNLSEDEQCLIRVAEEIAGRVPYA